MSSSSFLFLLWLLLTDVIILTSSRDFHVKTQNILSRESKFGLQLLVSITWFVELFLMHIWTLHLTLSGGEKAETPIICAIKNQKPKLATFFLEVGANPNVQNKNGSSLLQYAAQAGMLELLKKIQEM